jgi:hypothetical protein
VRSCRTGRVVRLDLVSLTPAASATPEQDLAGGAAIAVGQGRLLLPTSAERVVELDARTLRPVDALEPGEVGGRGPPFRAAAAGGPCVALGGGRSASSSKLGEGVLRVWDAHAPGPPQVIAGVPSSVMSIAVGPRAVAFGALSGYLFLLRSGRRDYDTLTSQGAHTPSLEFTQTAHNGHVTGLAFSPDGARLVSVSGCWRDNPEVAPRTNELRVWRVADGALLHTAPALPRALTSVAWSPDGEELLVGTAVGTLQLWRPPPLSDGAAPSGR